MPAKSPQERSRALLLRRRRDGGASPLTSEERSWLGEYEKAKPLPQPPAADASAAGTAETSPSSVSSVPPTTEQTPLPKIDLRKKKAAATAPPAPKVPTELHKATGQQAGAAFVAVLAGINDANRKAGYFAFDDATMDGLILTASQSLSTRMAMAMGVEEAAMDEVVVAGASITIAVQGIRRNAAERRRNAAAIDVPQGAVPPPETSRVDHESLDEVRRAMSTEASESTNVKFHENRPVTLDNLFPGVRASPPETS